MVKSLSFGWGLFALDMWPCSYLGSHSGLWTCVVGGGQSHRAAHFLTVLLGVPSGVP